MISMPRRVPTHSATPSQSSNWATYRLTAPWVTDNSTAARVRLPLRAATSNARSAFIGGRRRLICSQFSCGLTDNLCLGRAAVYVSVISNTADASCRYPGSAVKMRAE